MDYDGLMRAADFLKAEVDAAPALGIIIGTGLEGILDSVDVSTEVRYEDIPGFDNIIVRWIVNPILFLPDR